MNYHQIAGLFSVMAGLAFFLPYLVSLFQNKIRPHIFSWIIWSITQGIIFAAQTTSNAGPGAWVTGISALACFGVALASIKHGEKNISIGDWISLLVALAAIPLWTLTKNPLYSVIILTVMDTIGYYPTIRKSWKDPYSESIIAYSLSVASCILSLAAIELFIPVNWIDPLCMGISNALLVVILLLRREQLIK